MEGQALGDMGILTCKICTKNKAKYTCPRCSINYCSLTCYRDRRHYKCSEKFYRDCCENAIKSLSVDDEKRRQIEGLLAEKNETEEDYDKYESDGSENESTSEESIEDLTERIKDIDLSADNIDIDKIWKLLSPKEKREFHRQIATGTIYSTVPVWTPWWQSASKKIIKSFPDDLGEDLPPRDYSTDADSLSNLISKEPHPSIIFSLMETLLGYVFVSRFFNGDHLEDVRADSCDVLLKLVSYLQPIQSSSKKNVNKTRIVKTSLPSKMIIFSDFSEVLASLQSRLAQNRLPCSHKLLLILTDDLHCLLQNFDALVNRALKELLEILSPLKSGNNQLYGARHKIKFLRACTGKRDEASKAWCEKYIAQIFNTVEVSICEQTMRIDAEEKQADPSKTDQKLAGPNWRNIIRDNDQISGPLIEEIDMPDVSDTDM